MSEFDAVNKPKHYNKHPSGVECKDIAMFFPTPLANAIKYVWRYEDKENPIQDLEKCIWYLNYTKRVPPEFIKAQLAIGAAFIDIREFDKYLEYEEKINFLRYSFMLRMQNLMLHDRIRYDRELIDSTIELVLDIINERNKS